MRNNDLHNSDSGMDNLRASIPKHVPLDYIIQSLVILIIGLTGLIIWIIVSLATK